MLDDPTQGSCVGYEVRSHLTFATLRAGGGTPLYIHEQTDGALRGKVVASWEPRPENPSRGRILKNGPRYGLWTSDTGWYTIDPTVPSIGVPAGVEPLKREVRLFGVPAAICAFEQGDISVHASAVEVNGMGILLAGPSRYGKTTLAAAFAQAGHRLLCEDSTRCRMTSPPSIFPGPSIFRLRSDVADSLHIGSAPASTSGEDGRVPLIVKPSVRGDGDAVPLQAVFLLHEGSDAPTLKRAPAVEALRDVFALTFRLPGVESSAECFTRVARLTAEVPTFRLYRRMTIESLPEVVELVRRHLASAG